jgi:hypothetical protein
MLSPSRRFVESPFDTPNGIHYIGTVRRPCGQLAFKLSHDGPRYALNRQRLQRPAIEYSLAHQMGWSFRLRDPRLRREIAVTV